MEPDKNLVLDMNTGKVKAVEQTAPSGFDENRILCDEEFNSLYDENGNILLGL